MNDNFDIYRLKAELCKNFADPKRLMIIDQLRSGERSVGELAENIKVKQSVVSRHLALLRQSGIVYTRREGTTVFYRLSDPKIYETCEMMHEILLRQIENNRKLTSKFLKKASLS